MNLPDKLQCRGVGRHGGLSPAGVAASDEHHIPFLHAVGADLRRESGGMLVDAPVRREDKLPVAEDDGGASVATHIERIVVCVAAVHCG